MKKSGLLLYFLSSALIFKIYSLPYLHVQSKNLKKATIEKIEFCSKMNEASDETITRNGILVRYPGAQATLLICHGFMCDKYDVAFLRTLFTPGLLNYLSFDFRAHGENTQNQFCTFGHNEVFDVQAAVQYIKSHPDLKDKPILVYGFSMGAVACIEAQAQDPTMFKAMILDCPFDSTENVIKKGLDQLKISIMGYEFDLPGKGLLEKHMFHPYVQNLIKTALKTVAHMDTLKIATHIYPITPVESIKKITIPCFFIHCKNDQKVSIEAIKKLYNNAAGYKKLWMTNGRRHFDSFFYNPERYIIKLNKFVNRVLTNDISSNKVSEDSQKHDAIETVQVVKNDSVDNERTNNENK